MRPVDRCPQRLLARIRIATALEHVKPLRDSLEDLPGRQDAHPCGSKLDGERQIVERPAELAGDLVWLRFRTGIEEFDALAIREGQDWVMNFAPHAQEFAARDEEMEVGAALDERGEFRRRFDDLLDVVEQEQQLALADVLGETVFCAERVRDRVCDERGLAK